MKKNLFKVMAMAAVAALTFSCSDNAKSDSKIPASAGNTSQLIAYVEVDTIMSQYEFCKEMKAQLESKGQNIENALKAQEQNLQAAAQNFQSKLQNNGFSSRQEAENQQAAIERQQQQYMASQQRASLLNSSPKQQNSNRRSSTVCNISLPTTTKIRNMLSSSLSN